MSISKITGVIPPPHAPLEQPTPAHWNSITSEIGQLPQDYIAFINTYGTGSLGDFLWIYNPASKNTFLNLKTQSSRILAALIETSRKFPELYASTLYPTKGGLLPFGGTDNGDSLFWVTTGDPEAWTIAIIGPRAPTIHRFAGSMTDFLCAIATSTYICPAFPTDLTATPFSFAPRLA